jgi:hypothetical protein
MLEEFIVVLFVVEKTNYSPGARRSPYIWCLCIGMSTPDLEMNESLITPWMLLARRNEKFHQDSAVYYKRTAEASMLTALVLGASSGLLNAVLGLVDPSTILINVPQVVIGMTGLTASIIVQVAKQL